MDRMDLFQIPEKRQHKPSLAFEPILASHRRNTPIHHRKGMLFASGLACAFPQFSRNRQAHCHRNRPSVRLILRTLSDIGQNKRLPAAL
jgi:hypothetical protein